LNHKTKRPGRDLNPGQKLRRLLGCPLPHRDAGNSSQGLTYILKTVAHPEVPVDGNMYNPGATTYVTDGPSLHG
jgi:hypothetical protein